MVWGGVLVIAVAAGTAWWSQTGRPQIAQTPNSTSVNAKAKPAELPVDKPIRARWTFEKGPPTDLKPIQMDWKWRAKSANSGEMVAPVEPGLIIPLPFEMPAHPVVINIKANVDIAGVYYAGACWLNGRLRVPVRDWNNMVYLRNQVRPIAVNISLYVIDRYIVNFRSGQATIITEAHTPYPSRELAVYFGRINVTEIEMHSLSPDEIPESVRDIPKLIEQMHVEPGDFDEHGKTAQQRAGHD